MKITEQLNLFVNEIAYKKNGTENTFRKATTSIVTKKEDGTILRMPIDVQFNTKKYPLEKLDPNFMYKVDVKKGWLAVDSYVRDGETRKKLVIFIDEMTIKEKTAIDQEKRKKALEGAKSSATEEDTDLPW